MFKIIGICLILSVVIQMSESGPVYQFLPPRDGYVPVYKRIGDTPLDEINPDLALAFHESNIETRNVNDLDETMQNDGPINDDLSESEEDVQDKVAIPKVPQNPIKSTDDEPDSVEENQSQKKSPEPNNTSEEEAEEKNEEASTQLTKESEESVEPQSTKSQSNADDSSSEEATKGRRTAPPPPPTKADNSSEEVDDKLSEQKPPHRKKARAAKKSSNLKCYT